MDKEEEKSDAEKKTIFASRLLERSPEKEYVDEWTRLIAKERGNEAFGDERSVVIFRMGSEWIALATRVFVELTRHRVAHRIPHRTGLLLQGVVNFRGQLWISVALHSLLEIELEETNEEEQASTVYKRMMAVEYQDDRWIFLVDEVFGVSHIEEKEIENVPVTVTKSSANYLKGIVHWKGQSVAYLDEELLFYSLKRSAL